MTKYNEGAYWYEFPAGWKVIRIQEIEFYIRKFQGFNNGSKEVDFVALDEVENSLWLVEAKDYSTHPRSKPGEVVGEIAIKIRDSLTCIEAMKVSSFSTEDSRALADTLSMARSCRVAFHLEVPAVENLSFSRVEIANMKMKLRNLLRGIDEVAKVGDCRQLSESTPIQISRK